MLVEFEFKLYNNPVILVNHKRKIYVSKIILFTICKSNSLREIIYLLELKTTSKAILRFDGKMVRRTKSIPQCEIIYPFNYYKRIIS